jgi:hypothetical protein
MILIPCSIAVRGKIAEMMNNQDDNEDNDIQVDAADNNSLRQSPSSRHQVSPLPRSSPALDEEEEHLSRQMADGDDMDEYTEPTVEDQESAEDASEKSSLIYTLCANFI